MKIFLTKKDFVPIPAELDEHVDNEVDVIVERSEVVALGNVRRNVHQFHKFEQMVESTFHEPVEKQWINENSSQTD